MDAEALYDSVLLVAGRLDETRFGPPDPVQVLKNGLATSIEKETALGLFVPMHFFQGLRLAWD